MNQENLSVNSTAAQENESLHKSNLENLNKQIKELSDKHELQIKDLQEKISEHVSSYIDFIF